MEATIVGADGRIVAAASSWRLAELSGDEWDGLDAIKCFFFNRVHLSPPILFEHLAGTGLSKFFNNTEVLLDGESLSKGLRYVHGRSEVMRGSTSINSVLLACPEPIDGMSDVDWLYSLPKIYSRFLEKYGGLAKSS